jgi:glyoxylase-like metal-dependent hydrolase (beta-lactamase superfamily II)
MAPGVRWLRMGCPLRWTTSTCGCCATASTAATAGRWSTAASTNDATRAAWEQVFATSWRACPVLRVIVTHMHPDHIGLAHWLCERWKRPLWISATDYNGPAWPARAPPASAASAAADFFASHGLTDPDAVAKVRPQEQLLRRHGARRAAAATGA